MNAFEERENSFPVASDDPRNPESGGSRTSIVTISNVFTDHNKGGAAITAETVQMVRRALPDARIRLVAVRHETSGFERSHRFTLDRFPDVSISGPLVATGHGPFAGLRAAARSIWLVCLAPRLASSPAVRSIRESNAVVSKGGHVFVERGGLRRSISLWMTSLPLLLAARLQVPTAILCTTVGPFSTWHSRAVAAFVLRRISRVVVRDDRSYGEAVALGVDPDRVTSLPDIVFSAQRPAPERSREVAARLGFENDRFCAVTVSEGPYDQEFFKNLKRTLTLLLERGVLDRVVVTCHAGEDVELSRTFVGSFDDSRAVFLEEDLSPDDLIALYGAARCLIGRRMHSAIFALVAGIPTFAFTKSGMKVQGVMESIGLKDLIMPYPEFDPVQFALRIERELSDPSILSARIGRAVNQAADEVNRIPGLLFGILGEGGESAPVGEFESRSMQSR